MLSEGCQFKVVRTTGGYEVLGRASNIPIGRAAFQMPKPKYPRDPIEPAPNPSPPSPATADAAAASLRRHVLPKDLPTAIRQLDDQELDRLLAAALAEQKRRGRQPAASVETPDNPRTEAATVHLTPGKLNAVRAAFKAGVKPSQIARQSACPSPTCGRRWRAMHRGDHVASAQIGVVSLPGTARTHPRPDAGM
jgi:hypothetical protein